MALSELDMMNLWAKQLRGHKSQWERLFDFGYAIEAEVRKQDEALILMLVERLERADKISGHANNKAAIEAGRAWLEAKK